MQWEYMVFRELPEAELNDIGDEGWDIVNAEFTEEEGVLTNVLAKRSRGGERRPGPGRRRRPRPAARAAHRRHGRHVHRRHPWILTVRHACSCT